MLGTYLNCKKKNSEILKYFKLEKPEIFKVNSETKLENLRKIAKDLKVSYCLIEDAGRTQIKAGSKTVIGIGPIDENDIILFCKDLKKF